MQTLMSEDGKLWKEVCKFLDLPVLDSKKQINIISPEMIRKCLEKKIPTLKDLKKHC